jgi:hypothetical protein
MAFEAKRCGHGAIAVGEVAVGGIVAARTGQLRAHPQQLNVIEHEPGICWYGG